MTKTKNPVGRPKGITKPWTMVSLQISLKNEIDKLKQSKSFNKTLQEIVDYYKENHNKENQT